MFVRTSSLSIISFKIDQTSLIGENWGTIW